MKTFPLPMALAALAAVGLLQAPTSAPGASVGGVGDGADHAPGFRDLRRRRHDQGGRVARQRTRHVGRGLDHP